MMSTTSTTIYLENAQEILHLNKQVKEDTSQATHQQFPKSQSPMDATLTIKSNTTLKKLNTLTKNAKPSTSKVYEMYLISQVFRLKIISELNVTK